MSGYSCRSNKSTALKSGAKANFAWRSMSSDEVPSQSRIRGLVYDAEPELTSLDNFGQGADADTWRILLDDSDDSTFGWGQNSSSSSASWSDDLESEATSRLQVQLSVLDKIVFGEDLTPQEAVVHIPDDLLEEATLWKTSYPHLRVKGVSLPIPYLQGEFKDDKGEEVLASHSVISGNKRPCDEPVKLNSEIDSASSHVPEKDLSDLKSHVMKRLYDYLWPDVLECVKWKILACPRDPFNWVKESESLPFLTNRVASAKWYPNNAPRVHQTKYGSHSLEVPDKNIYKQSPESSGGHLSLDSILKVSSLPLKHSATANVPPDVIQRSYKVLSSRGQTHVVNHHHHHVTLPPIEVPSDPIWGNSFEGSLPQLRSTSAFCHEHHQIAGSRPSTSTLVSAHQNSVKPSFISVSPSRLTKNLSFSVLGQHLPANSNLPWCKANQRKSNNIHR